MLASYASFPAHSKGRFYKEAFTLTPWRDCYQRDRDRIIHSSAFRKLQYKTQVFLNYENDYYRTRLTHSLEVAQIARSIARALKINEDLTEAIALAHDLGHPPFGHAGEDALKEVTKEYSMFDHNAQAVRILTYLEQRYISFNGLNLTWEMIEGITKHNGPIEIEKAHKIIKDYNSINDLQLNTYASIEAQVAAISDDIAYNCHDIDDGLRSNILSLDQLATIPLLGELLTNLKLEYPGTTSNKLIQAVLRYMINLKINDVIKQTTNNIAKFNIKNVEQVRALSQSTVSFTPELKEYTVHLKNFLFENLYRSYRVNRSRSKSKRIIKELFNIFFNEPECLPNDWRVKAESMQNDSEKALIICDFISGMTDRYAIKEHQRLFDNYNFALL